jgi:hypothetical protein
LPLKKEFVVRVLKVDLAHGSVLKEITVGFMQVSITRNNILII